MLFKIKKQKKKQIAFPSQFINQNYCYYHRKSNTLFIACNNYKTKGLSNIKKLNKKQHIIMEMIMYQLQNNHIQITKIGSMMDSVPPSLMGHKYHLL